MALGQGAPSQRPLGVWLDRQWARGRGAGGAGVTVPHCIRLLRQQEAIQAGMDML